MPLPLFLLIGAGVAAATGVGSTVYGAAKAKDANDTMKLAERRHNENIKNFEQTNENTNKTMDKLGTLEMDILSSFRHFSSLFEKIQNKPEFRSYRTDDVELPKYNPEEINKVSVGAGVLMGGIGGAALGTAGGFAAAGATTAAVMALGTASTGTAIASLSGVAATNATLAALGGGALAAGGGGIALGTTVLGAATAGVGLLVGGVIFGIVGKSLSSKADEAWRQMKTAEEKINTICSYLSDLDYTAKNYRQVLQSVNNIYRKHLDSLDTLITVKYKTDWNTFTTQEKMITENTVLLVQLLYQMCKVKLVLVSEKKDELNKINKIEINKSTQTAKKLLQERNFAVDFKTTSYDCIFEVQECKGRSDSSTDYKGVVITGTFHKNANVKLVSSGKEINATHIHWIQKRYSNIEHYYASETAGTNDIVIISLPSSAPYLHIGDQIVIGTNPDSKSEIHQDFKMEIEDVHRLASGNITVSGLVIQGKITKGDKVTIKRTIGRDIIAEIKGISVSSRLCSSAALGDYAELCLNGIDVSAVGKKDMVYRHT